MGDEQVLVTISNPFAMMDTVFTQMMWARLKIAMGEKNPAKINPSYFKEGFESITVNIDGIMVVMKPNHPVEKVSWYAVQEFIDGLNDLSNYGDSKIQALLQELFPGHQRGDHYDFPTEAQLEYVKTNLGNNKYKFFDRDNIDVEELNKYAVFDANSKSEEFPKGSTQNVLSRLPRLIAGKMFYGLEGNVFQWMKDSWDGKSRLSGGVDPLGLIGDYKVLRGGSWINMPSTLRATYRYGLKVVNHKGSYDVGFRLVRTRQY
jgi:formylglycine-generating enzyme required for sulfatase activity